MSHGSQSIRPGFEQTFKPNTLYRSTGNKLYSIWVMIPSLNWTYLGPRSKTFQLKKLFTGVDAMRNKYGKHTLFLGSSHLANRFSQHLGDRGDEPLRKQFLLKGETK